MSENIALDRCDVVAEQPHAGRQVVRHLAEEQDDGREHRRVDEQAVQRGGDVVRIAEFGAAVACAAAAAASAARLRG